MANPAHVHASQEWSFVRFPLHTGPRPSLSDPSSTALATRQFRLQNVATGGFATHSVSRTDGPNVIVQPDPTRATPWQLLYHGHWWSESRHNDDTFALCTGSARARGSLDLWGGAYMHLVPGKLWLWNEFHNWRVLPRAGGAFAFRSVSGGTLLGSTRGEEAVLHPMPVEKIDDTACHWRLVDARTSEAVPMVYDTRLAVLPPDLASDKAPSDLGEDEESLVPPVRAEEPSARIHATFAASFAGEHKLVQEMLALGYESLVVAPGTVYGWRDGGMRAVSTLAEDTALTVQRWRGKDSYEPCLAHSKDS